MHTQGNDVSEDRLFLNALSFGDLSKTLLKMFLVTCKKCRFQGGKKEELIGIAYNRLIRMDASTSDAIKTWRFSNMKQWNVNWEIKMVSKAFPTKFSGHAEI